jgi:hypothetical protein
MSTSDVHDLRSTIIPRSDQLNSEQLLGGPMVITVTEVRAGGGEDQPVSVFHNVYPDRPYKPCKTMRKVLILAWGPDGTKWVGKSMELYCEPSVKFGGEVVGGIRISRLSDIPKDIKVSLTATKGRKAMHEIKPLEQSRELKAALDAIAAATGRDSLQKARALAEALTDEGEIATAVAAYGKKVEELKSRAPSKPAKPVLPPADDVGGDEITFTAEQVEHNIRAAATTDVLDLARDQIAGVQDEAARLRLTELADQREAELREPT